MGVFDEVVFACPKCGEHLFIQSKAGDPSMRIYSLDNVPPRIAGDIDGAVVTCEDCSIAWKLTAKVIINIARYWYGDDV